MRCRIDVDVDVEWRCWRCWRRVCRPEQTTRLQSAAERSPPSIAKLSQRLLGHKKHIRTYEVRTYICTSYFAHTAKVPASAALPVALTGPRPHALLLTPTQSTRDTVAGESPLWPHQHRHAKMLQLCCNAISSAQLSKPNLILPNSSSAHQLQSGHLLAEA